MWAPYAQTQIAVGAFENIYYPSIVSFGAALTLSMVNLPLAFSIKWPDLRLVEIQRKQSRETRV